MLYVHQVRSLQLIVMLQERITTFIRMLGPLLDELIQLVYFAVDAFGKETNVRQIISPNRIRETFCYNCTKNGKGVKFDTNEADTIEIKNGLKDILRISKF